MIRERERERDSKLIIEQGQKQLYNINEEIMTEKTERERERERKRA